ncbi:putative membrane protein YfcA [Pontibacter aydingkolensis]|uniref:TSUP family transporter n=1 Tax=Pontibacter aydingkolensis TaxID=1911536 RepID=UPI001FE5F6B7|nr:TSUP family transporter [Pontibacter aydingkolensis]
MEYLLICITSFIASGLTFFSGFGLGTLLVPVFALFFPIDIAIALTAVVHFLNNLFKLTLIGRHAQLPVVLKFGLPSMVAAFAGAGLLVLISE